MNIIKRGAISLITILILFISIVFPMFYNSNYLGNADSNIDTFHDGTTEKSIKVSNIETSFFLEIPIQSEVLEASLNISVEKYKNNYPLNPRLSISNTQTSLWKYQGTGYGAFGKQYSFNSGAMTKEVIFDGNYKNSDTLILLPENSKIESAKINFTGIEYDYWNKSYQQLNLEPDGAGDYEPDLIEYKNRLYAVYRTYYDEITNGSDSDIVITSTQNSQNWSVPIELTESPDSAPPYNDTATSADWRPTLEVFDSKLFCAWESNSTTTTGMDHDILIRWTSDGNNWGSFINITDQFEDVYSQNPGIKNDWTVDMITFNNSLWLLWATNNTGPESGFKTPFGDIMVANSSDGVNWNTPFELTSGDDWFINDYSPTFAVFNDTLYAVWVSNNSKFTEGDTNDYDIVFRTTKNGITWSDLRAINPHDNEFPSNKGSLDTRPVLTTFNDALYCAWVSAASYTYGNDLDIYLRYTHDGNFTELGMGGEVTNSDNDYPDHSPHIIGFNDRVYITWVSELETIVNDIPYNHSEIFINYFDPTTSHFGVEQQLGPVDQDGFDYWPKLAVFNNELYAAWDSNDTGTGHGMDRDIIITNNLVSKLPLGFGLDIGNDETWEIIKNSPLTGSKTTFELTAGLNKALSNNSWVDANTFNTNYGYRMCEVPLTIFFSGPGKIRAEDLEIVYNCSVRVKDLSAEINEFVLNNLNKATKNNTVLVPFILRSDTTGKVGVKDLKIVLNYKPTITILNIPATGVVVDEPVYRISWSDFDPDDNATIELYYDLDNKNFDGSLIVSNLSENSKNDYFNWVWWQNQELRNGGEFYIYSRISDGRNEYYNYSMGPLKLQKIKINDFLNITITEPDGINDAVWETYEIQWQTFARSKNLKVELFYDNDNQSYNGQQIDINNDGKITEKDYILMDDFETSGSGKLSWDISKFPPGSSFFIYSKITDQWNISVYNYSSGPLTRLHMPAPKNFSILHVDIGPDKNLTIHNRNPTLIWEPPLDTPVSNNSLGDLEYVIKLWEGIDSSGAKLYEVKTDELEATVNPVSPLRYGNSYYAEVFARVKSSQNESMKNSLVFSLVNTPPSAPIIKITPTNPKYSSILTCVIVNASIDPDGDSVKYIYHWFKNGFEQNDYVNSTSIPTFATSKGERWRCLVTAYDNIELGGSADFNVIIKNSAPIITIDSPGKDKKFTEDDVITFRFKATDPDPGDAEKLQFIVIDQNSGQSLKTGYVQAGTGVVEFTKKLEPGTYNIKINVTDGEAGAESEFILKVSSSEPDDLSGIILPLFIGIILIIVILVIVFIILFSRINKMKKEFLKDKEEEQEQDLDVEEVEPDMALATDELVGEDEEEEIDELEDEEILEE